jgi:hypothetical protein
VNRPQVKKGYDMANEIITLTNLAEAFAGELVERRIVDEDGVHVSIVPVYRVGVVLGKREYVHESGFRSEFEAAEFADRVNARGSINLDHWERVLTLEERLSDELYREDQERFAA